MDGTSSANSLLRVRNNEGRSLQNGSCSSTVAANTESTNTQHSEEVDDEKIKHFDAHELGDQVTRMISINTNDEENSKRRSLTVASILFLSFLLAYGAIIPFVTIILHSALPTPNTDQLFDQFDDPYEEIIKDTIPLVREWFRDLTKTGEKLLDTQSYPINQDNQNKNLANALNHHNNATSCVDPYFDEMQRSVATTTPAFAWLALQNLGTDIYESELIRGALRDLLTEPQDLKPMYESSHKCLSNNHPFEAMACTANDFISMIDLSDPEARVIFEYLVNYAAVMERLTLVMETNLPILAVLAEALNFSRRSEREEEFREDYKNDEAKLEFYIYKIRGVASYLSEFMHSKSQNEVSKKEQINLQVNILEAVKLDILHGHEENARVGLALASAVHYGPFADSNMLHYPLGKEWVDAYIAWNFVFVFSTIERFDIPVKLLIPSISCTNNSTDDGGRFVSRRVISLSIGLIHSFEPPMGDNEAMDISQEDVEILEQFFQSQEHYSLGAMSPLPSALGKSNMENIILTNPDNDSVMKMLYILCGGMCYDEENQPKVKPIRRIEDDDFLLYVGFLLWATMIITGVGFEFFFSYLLLYHLKRWTPILELLWRLAQFLFPLFAFVSLILAKQQNALSVLFCVFGCWKFGFPETLMGMFSALYEPSLSKRVKASFFFDSIAILLHHSAASLVICMVMLGVARPERYVLEPTLIVCFQHLFVWVKYCSWVSYIFIMLLIEFWFQWNVLSNLKDYGYNHWTMEVAALMMVISHWVWLVTGAISSVVDIVNYCKRRTADGHDDSASKESKD